VERPSSLQQRLINPPPTSDNPNRRPRSPGHRLLRPTRQTDPRLVVVRGMADHRRVVPARAGERTTVAYFLLDVADDGAFGALGDGEDVADGEGGFFAAVDKGAGVEAFGGDEGFFAEFVAVGITEDDAGEGGTTTGVGVRNSFLWFMGDGDTHRPASWMISFTIPRM